MVDEGHRLRGHDVVLGDGEQRRLLEGQTPWIFWTNELQTVSHLFFQILLICPLLDKITQLSYFKIKVADAIGQELEIGNLELILFH